MEDGNVYYVDIDTTEIEKLLGELTEQNKENHEIIITDLNVIAETQSYLLTANMLMCGLLGLIIGICFVNIFKSR